jgi:hypothetical protein
MKKEIVQIDELGNVSHIAEKRVQPAKDKQPEEQVPVSGHIPAAFGHLDLREFVFRR